jgi:CheY-like chemotaxis protein
VDLQKVLEISLRLAWNEIRHRAVLVQDFSPVPHVQGNESRLSQVFLNLLVNAVQSIPSVGQAEQHQIRISLREDPQGVRVTLQDTGLGIAPEVMQRLFTPFFTTKPIGEGTGLGLTICRRIIENHQGQLTIESTPGHGTVVSVVLPVAATAPAPRPTSLPPIAQTGHILVIDDEPIITSVVRRILGARYTVETCNEASQALAWLKQGRRFDLILCDLMMPHMSGMDFHEEVSCCFPMQLPSLFFLTGGAFTQKTRAFLNSIPGRFLEKPFQSAELLRFVGEHVSLGLQR